MNNEEATTGCASSSLLRNLVASFSGKKQRHDSGPPGATGCFTNSRSNSTDQRSADSGFEPLTRESTPQLPSPVVLNNAVNRRRQPLARLPSSSSASSLQFVLATHRPQMPKIVQKMLREKQKEYVRLKMMQNRAQTENGRSNVPTATRATKKAEQSAGHLLIKLAYCNEVRHVSTTLGVIGSLAGLRLLFVTLFQSTFDCLSDEYVHNKPIYIQVPCTDILQETIIFRLLRDIAEIKDGCTLILCDNTVQQTSGLLDSFSVTGLTKSQLSTGRSTYACTSNDQQDRTTTEKQYSTPFSLDSPMSSDVFITQANSPGQSTGYVKVYRTQTKAAQTDLRSKTASACTFESQRTECATLVKKENTTKLSVVRSVSNPNEQLSNVFGQLNLLRGELAAVRKLQVSVQAEFSEQLSEMINEIDHSFRIIGESPNNAVRRDREIMDALAWRFHGEQQDALGSLSEIENIVRALRNHILSQSNSLPSSASSLHLCTGTSVSQDEANYYGEQLERIIERFRNLLQQFESLDQRLTPIRRQELDLLAKEERFMREEPRILESALKRCQNLNTIIATLKRIAQLQQSHLCEQCRPTQPTASLSCQNTPATMPRFIRSQSRPVDAEAAATFMVPPLITKRCDSGKAALNRVVSDSLMQKASNTLQVALDGSCTSVNNRDGGSPSMLTNSTISRASAASTASSSNSSADTVVHAKH